MAVSEQSVLEFPDAHRRQKTSQRCTALLDSFFTVPDCLLPCVGPNPLVKPQEVGCVRLSSYGLWHRHILILVYRLGHIRLFQEGECVSV